MSDKELKVEARKVLGKEESGRLRVAGKLPGVVYGPGSDPRPVVTDPAEVLRVLRSKSGKNTVLLLKSEDKTLDGKRAMIREHQTDTITDKLIHLDLMEVSKERRIRVSIPIDLEGKPVGVDKGGTVEELLREIEISCLPDEIPGEGIKADISQLDIGDALHVKDLKLEKFKVLTNPNLTFVTVAAPQKEEEVKPAAEAVPGEIPAEGAVEGAVPAEAAAAEGEAAAPAKGKEAAPAKGKEAAPAKGKEAAPAKGKEAAPAKPETKAPGKRKEEGRGRK